MHSNNETGETTFVLEQGQPQGKKDSGTETIDHVHAAPAGEQVGSILADKYRILEKIGEGGMGIVFKVEQVFLAQSMALKTLAPDRYSEASLKRFQAEARLLARLDHPALVKVLDFGLLSDDKPYIAMDFVEGKTLAELLKIRGVFTIEQAVKIFIEVCFAIGYAHDQGVIHRDIKPSNIMINFVDDFSGPVQLKVLDFGIAKFVQNCQADSDALTRTGEVMGSPLYMSPEQCFGRPIDHRSDIYSIGCMMFEVLTGAPPFSGSTALNTMMLHESGQALSLKEASFGREFPEKLENIIRKMMAKDPDCRYQSLCEVARALISIQEQATFSEHKATQEIEKSALMNRVNVNLSAIAAALAVICSITVVLYLTFSNTPKPEQSFTTHSIHPDMRWSELSHDGQTKIFSFPDTFSLGTITFGEPPNELVVEAKGTRSFPVKSKLGFTPSPKFLAYPKFLRAFRPDDLYYIDFSNAQSMQMDRFGAVTDSNILTDDEMMFLDHLSGLKYLSIKGTRVTDKGLAYIGHLQNLRLLNINGTDITGRGLQSTAFLQNLVWLDANNIRNGGAVISGLKGSKNIECLFLADAQLKNEDLRLLATMPNLQRLNIVFNADINDEGMKYLLPLHNLKEVELQDCNVTAKGLEALEQMHLINRPKLSERLGWKQNTAAAEYIKSIESKN